MAHFSPPHHKLTLLKHNTLRFFKYTLALHLNYIFIINSDNFEMKCSAQERSACLRIQHTFYTVRQSGVK